MGKSGHPATAETILSPGVDMILTIKGFPITNGVIIVKKGTSVKPCSVSCKAVLFVEGRAGVFRAGKRD